MMVEMMSDAMQWDEAVLAVNAAIDNLEEAINWFKALKDEGNVERCQWALKGVLMVKNDLGEEPA